MKKLFVISCIWLMGISLFAQSTITGKVTAKDDGQPLPGVNIVVKGTTTGTITDFDGNYSLQAEAAAVLVYSFVGYVPQEVVVGNIKVINVSLASESIGLNEMVVTALGIKKNQKMGYRLDIPDCSKPQCRYFQWLHDDPNSFCWWRQQP